MDLLQQAQAALAGCASSGTGRHSLGLEDATRRVTCELTRVDSLACEFLHLTLRTDALAEASTEQLKELSERLAERLTYLLEPISPIETDAEGCTVQMRSNPPQRGDDGTCYFELLVRRGGELSLRRWKKAEADARTLIPSTVTREVLLRLISDFSEAAG